MCGKVKRRDKAGVMEQEIEVTNIYPFLRPILQYLNQRTMEWLVFLLLFLVMVAKSIHSPSIFSHGTGLPAIDSTGSILIESNKTYLRWC